MSYVWKCTNSFCSVVTQWKFGSNFFIWKLSKNNQSTELGWITVPKKVFPIYLFLSCLCFIVIKFSEFDHTNYRIWRFIFLHRVWNCYWILWICTQLSIRRYLTSLLLLGYCRFLSIHPLSCVTFISFTLKQWVAL